MKTIHLKNENNVLSCEMPISQEQWLELLLNKTTEDQLKALLYFYYADNNTGTCKSIGARYSVPSAFINRIVTSFGQMVQRDLNQYEIVREGGTKAYWPFPMAQGRDLKNSEDGVFEWTLRPELVDALRQYLYTYLVQQYKELRKNIPFRDDKQDEVYKWELITECAGKDDLYIADRVTRSNLVYATLTRGTISYLIENKRNEISSILNDLLRGDADLDSRVRAFKDYMAKAVPKEFNYKANDERTAAAILTCYNPQQYTFYKFEVYQALCQYLGIEPKETGLCFSHFQKLITPLRELIDKDVELLELVKTSTNNCIQSSLLVAQDILWMVLVAHPKAYLEWLYPIIWHPVYWCVGYNFGSSNSQLERFLKDGIWEGRFNPNESGDKRQITLANKIKEGDILILKSSATKGEGHKTPFVRVRAIAQVTGAQDNRLGDDGYQSIIRNVNYTNCDLSNDFNGSTYGKYRKTVDECTHNEIKEYVNSIINMPNNKHQEIIDLLEANHNLILSGAPGTGKTYMAKEIAETMGAECKMVQFHPSYDYTDFVEGLRPQTNATFKRVDGVFKAFCAEALRNYRDSQKSKEILEKEKSIEERVFTFLDDAKETGNVYKIKTGSEFSIVDYDDKTITFYNATNPVTKEVVANVSDIMEMMNSGNSFEKVKDVTRFFNRTHGAQKDSYLLILYQQLLKQKAEKVSVNLVKRKAYIFIIDEINRGELSKILGELFFSIDPGYRGAKGKVNTQYQNMIDKDSDDPFKDGFFVPENVYIIGTMNDIDRSVESMDFAMRRRFAWKEVTAAESYNAIIRPNNDFTESQKTEIEKRMTRLNAEIEKQLGRAYQIGAAYFLKLKETDYEALWTNHLEGLLYEYFRGERNAEKTVENLHAIYNNEQ